MIRTLTRLTLSLLGLDLVLVALGTPPPLVVTVALLALSTAFLAAGEDTLVVVRDLAAARRDREAARRRTVAAALAVPAGVGALLLLAQPSIGADGPLPDVSRLRPFSAETNYLSRAGYLRYLRMNRGASRGVDPARAARWSPAQNLAAAPRFRSIQDPNANPTPRILPARVNVVHESRDGAYVERRFAELQRLCLADRARRQPRYGREGSRFAATRTGRRRVVVLPFDESRVAGRPDGRVTRAVGADLARKGFQVVSGERLAARFGRPVADLGAEEMRRIAEELEADLVVSGDVSRYDGFKKVRVAGLIVGGLLTGVHAYGEAEVGTRVYRASTGRIVYENRASERGKNQVLGIVTSTQGPLDRATDGAVHEALRGFPRP